jgi:hypothetical protein
MWDPHADELRQPLLCSYGIEGMLTKICLAYVKLLAYRGAVVSGAAKKIWCPESHNTKEHFPHGFTRFLTGITSSRGKWRDWHATYISFPYLQTSIYHVAHTSARKVTLSFRLFPRRIIRFSRGKLVSKTRSC